MGKVFVFDYDRCNGCRGCQVACKDEHCEQPWLPYAEAQPLTGQFWCKVTDRERGEVPWVKVSYDFVMCNHCADAPCMKAATGDAVYRREDGLVIIDPEKSKGQKAIMEACPMGAVYWNDALDIPQKCTGCAHLLDDGWTVPRCVDVCATGALKYVDESEVDMDKAETMGCLEGFGPKVYYYNVPKRFVVGTVVDLAEDEVVIGADVDLKVGDEVVATMKTDDFGDFKFDQVEPEAYTVVVHDSHGDFTVEANAVEKDVYVGEIFVTE